LLLCQLVLLLRGCQLHLPLLQLKHPHVCFGRLMSRCRSATELLLVLLLLVLPVMLLQLDPAAQEAARPWLLLLDCC
jgi:hypothetical protein